MIESLLFVIALTLSISGVYILKKFADNEHDKDFVRMQRHGNKMSVSCLLMIWLIIIYSVMSLPHHLASFCDCDFLFIPDSHEYKMIHNVIAYAMVGVGLKIINQVIEYQKKRRKTDKI